MGECGGGGHWAPGGAHRVVAKAAAKPGHKLEPQSLTQVFLRAGTDPSRPIDAVVGCSVGQENQCPLTLGRPQAASQPHRT